MDMDTTKRKHAHEEMLAAFAAGKADILLGTQMIVKGHDYANVTLVGILAADLSLHEQDFRSGEKTFQLLCQAAGEPEEERRQAMLLSRHTPRNIMRLLLQPDILMRISLRKNIHTGN